MNMGGAEWWFAVLTLMAVVFVVWPVLFSQKKNKQQGVTTESESLIAERIALNNALYDENLKEIDAQFKREELTEEECEKIKTELLNQLNQDNEIKASSQNFSVAGGKWLVITTAVLIPVVALFIYGQRGNYADWQIDQLIRESNRLAESQASKEQVVKTSRELLKQIERRVEQRPENLNNWIMLARTAFELQEYKKSIAGYQKILDQSPNSPQVLSELAQVVFVSSGNQFLPPVKQLFDRALSIDPNNQQILSLVGFDAYQAGDYENAIHYWERLLENLPPSDRRHATWSQAVKEAKIKAGIAVVESNEPAKNTTPDAKDAPFINVSVALGDEVKGSVSASDTVFIYARAANGPKMPLAMQRLTVADLPVTVRLDESTAMAAGMTIKQFPRLEVVARVSKSGSAASQSGDWQAIAPPISTAPNVAVELVINSKIP